MKKREFTFYGTASLPCELHAVVWLPDGEEVDKVLQVVHGMTEQ